MRSLRPLDPTWWRKIPGGYDQQDGRARLKRVRGNVNGWAVFIHDECRGIWSTLREAKEHAAALPVTTAGVPGYSNFGGGGPFAPMGSPKKDAL